MMHLTAIYRMPESCAVCNVTLQMGTGRWLISSAFSVYTYSHVSRLKKQFHQFLKSQNKDV